MKYLVVGLGNIGDEYTNTRHNIGFKVLDALANASSLSFKTDRLGDVAHLKFKGRTFILLKPSTYMNLSGKAVNYWMQQEKISLLNTIIITDDLALPFGKVRMRGKGSDGGHNGLKSINQMLGRTDYARIRFGVGNEFDKGKQVDYVLGEWSKEENDQMTERLDVVKDMIIGFGTIGLNRSMSAYNNK
jgi:PTH1 family peptidyl-tRNA hydrolase